MKLEIDSSDERELLRLQKELRRNLSIVDHALSLLRSEPDVRPVSDAGLISETESKTVSELISGINGDFTIKDLESDTRAIGISGSVIRREVYQMAESGKLIIVKQGAGRAPTIYRRK